MHCARNDYIILTLLNLARKLYIIRIAMSPAEERLKRTLCVRVCIVCNIIL